ncbi:hypothetical protein Lfu02_68260 [Longispora fulva]|uniref:Secreted trypsin-like serine protease n=1 Tax=Longispora fulva TaxID=619741 RepID=A0A8J7G738_9ACTN|nr:trypsin-like serine protease [Longispora fulva]MBG6134080.1 secreted trypsin-like serine protease [Longispora fulva]GIG62454.1 hypothetical protein Lfu02_68260 [Longispora fulva]
MRRIILILLAGLAAALLPAAGAQAVKGGTDTTTAEYPWTVVITRPGSPHPQHVSCGGALVRPNKVLTAAHCLDATLGDVKDKTVMYGRDDLTTTAGVEAKISSYWVHPDYVSGKLDGDDIAILTLDKNVGASVVQVATDPATNAVGTNLTLSTYGFTSSTPTFTSHIQKATLPIVENAKCTDLGWKFNADKQLCLGPTKNDTLGVCKGDSGGGVVAGTPATGYKLVGLIESGDTNCAGPQVTSQLTHYAEIIRQQLDGAPTRDFSLAMSPAAGTVAPGSSATTTVATTTVSGEPQTVALSASGAPAGVTVTFNPASVTTGQNATATISVAATAAGGTYPITVSASGTTSHTATYTLTVEGGGNPPGTHTFTSTRTYFVPDPGSVDSPITATGTGSAASTVTVTVKASHWCGAELAIVLVAPDGRQYPVKSASTGACASFSGGTYQVPGVSAPIAGTWTLRVTDTKAWNFGALNGWTLTA